MSRIIKSNQAVAGAFIAYECGALGLAPTGLLEEGFDDPSLIDPAAESEIEIERRSRELYEDAVRQGYEAGETRFRESVGMADAALKAAAESLQRARDEFLASTEPQVLALVRAITERILFREARLDPEVVTNTVRAALRNLTERERLTVLLNPSDLEVIRRERIDLFAGIEGLDGVEVAPLETVGPGGCLVESDQVRVDARLDAQLEQILSALVV